jgi:uncharacterized membrane protein YiaA
VAWQLSEHPYCLEVMFVGFFSNISSLREIRLHIRHPKWVSMMMDEEFRREVK